MRRLHSVILGGGVIMMLTTPGMGFAQSATGQVSCDFSAKLNTLSTIQKNQTSDGRQTIIQELRVRKEMLASILMCATQEIKTIETSLEGAPIAKNEPQLEELRTQFEDQLTEVINFYQSQLAKINDLGLQGSKDLARTILRWRTSNVVPLKGNVASFLLWRENQGLFQAADDRFSEITRALQALDLAEHRDIKTLLDTSEKNLDDAKTMNEEIKKTFESKEIPDDMFARIKASLASLAATYQTFFELSKAVQTALPRTLAGQ